MYVGSGYCLTKHDCGDCSVAVYSRNLDASVESGVDPNLFDTGYTLAASTGLAKVCAASLTMLCMSRGIQCRPCVLAQRARARLSVCEPHCRLRSHFLAVRPALMSG